MNDKLAKKYHRNIIKARILLKEAQFLAEKLDISTGKEIGLAILALEGQELAEFERIK